MVKTLKLQNGFKRRLNSSMLLAKYDFKNKVIYSKEFLTNLYYKLEKELIPNSKIDENCKMISNMVDTFLSKQDQAKLSSFHKKIVFDDNLLNEITEKSNNSLTLKEIRCMYLAEYPKSKFGIETLRIHLIKNLKIKYLQCCLKNEKSEGPLHDLMLINYATLLLKAIDNDHIILYADEASFNDHKNNRKYWISSKSKKIKINKGRIPSISALAVISKYGLLNFQLNENTNTSEDFIEFIKNTELILRTNQLFSDHYKKQKISLIIDNCKLHCSKLTRKSLRKGKINIIYQPTYLPIINSTELIWSHCKRKMSRMNIKCRKIEVQKQLEILKDTPLYWAYRNTSKKLLELIKNLMK